MAEAFTGTAGEYVPLKDTIQGFCDIIDGKCDSIPESAFLYIGKIDDAYERAKTSGSAE